MKHVVANMPHFYANYSLKDILNLNTNRNKTAIIVSTGPSLTKQLELLREIKKCGKPIVCVHVSGSCMSLVEVEEQSDAILQCFYPGAEGGTALANVLFGRVSPSGRLPVTFYKSDSDFLPLRIIR